MGAYDELVLTISFKEDTPKQIIDTLRYMLDLAEVPIGEDDPPYPPLPDHPYFTKEARFELFTLEITGYLPGERIYKLSWDEVIERHHFTCRAIMKSGDIHIRSFVHWLLPYSDREGFHGYRRNDESPEYCDHIYLENGEVYFYQIYISKHNPPKITRCKITPDGRMIKTDS